MPAGTGEPEPSVEHIRELEERLDNLRISADSSITYRGSAWQGYAFNTPTCDEIGQGGTPPPPNPGACCLPDGTCETVTPGQCLLDGGTFIGGSCDPNPCTQTCHCACEGTGTPIPCRIFGTITLNCDCEVFCGVSSHIEEFDQALTGTGCQCFLTTPFNYDFDCGGDPGCSPCHISGGIIVEFDFGMSQWNVSINYGYDNAGSVDLCSFAATFPFDFSSGGPVTVDEDVTNGVPSDDCISHISLTIT